MFARSVRLMRVRPSLVAPGLLKRTVATNADRDLGDFTYIPEGKVVIDPATGKKKLVEPMTINDDLPEHPGRADRRKAWINFGVFAFLMSFATFGIFQYEKMSSPVMNASLYYLRRNPEARDKLGKDVTYSGMFPLIWGDLNTMRGHVDISTRVEGDRAKATMYLKADRVQDRTLIEKWTLVTDDGDSIDLMKGSQPLKLDFNSS